MSTEANQPRLVPGGVNDELVAVVALLRSQVLSPEKLSASIESVGSAVDLLPVTVGGQGYLGEQSMLLDAIDDQAVAAARSEVEAWQGAGHSVFTMLDDRYPANLRLIYNKPPLLFIDGEWNEELDSCAVAIVGTRKASLEGERRAFKLARALAGSGITVISGMALGIDGSAHKGALAGGGRTVAVMGTGVLHRYPAAHRGLAESILASGGALASQFFPDQTSRQWTFPKRNITMSGMSVATVVIEAGETSGAKMQAEAALRHGKPVFLPTSLVESHAWARKMISEGFSGAFAQQINSPDDLMSMINPSIPQLAPLFE